MVPRMVRRGPGPVENQGRVLGDGVGGKGEGGGVGVAQGRGRGVGDGRGPGGGGDGRRGRGRRHLSLSHSLVRGVWSRVAPRWKGPLVAGEPVGGVRGGRGEGGRVLGLAAAGDRGGVGGSGGAVSVRGRSRSRESSHALSSLKITL